MKPMEVDEFLTVDMDFQHPSDLGDLHLQNENRYRLMPVEPQTPPVEYIHIYIYRSNKFFRAKSMPIHGWRGWRWVMDSVSLPGILEAHHERKRRHDLFKATQSGNLNAMEIRHLFDDFFLRKNDFTCDVQLSSRLKEGECQHWKSTFCWSKLWSPQQQIGVPNGPQVKRSCY